ncbi:MAG TPA: glycosyltransferase family 4 protein [Candidatus Binatia bacterium]|jgi:glycosyltransferase involved in cell wall biosynthesis|nr:glycosyltransferase family 4 protein [Candidatus Binatia bacterium]
MRIVQLTPGTGNFYCGSCLRDNALVRGLRAKGHEVLMVPLYLPLVIDEPAENEDAPIFLSGISVFLEQKIPAFRHTPDWLNRALSSPALLRLAANLAGMTTARELGEAAVSMLQGEQSRQAQEVERLVTWLRSQPAPEVFCLSNSLLSGLTHRLKEEFHVPIVCTMQGEDSFLDALPEPYRKQSWDLLARRCAEIDQFIAVSQYFGDSMRSRLGLPAERVTVVYPGIAVEDFAQAVAPPNPPVIAYLARMHPAKGLDTLVEAFLKLKEWNRVPGLRLRIAGAMAGADNRFVDSLKKRLSRLSPDVEFLPNLDRHAKLEFLRTITVLSVPANYGEAFGLYLLEAWASGVPVVQPRHAAFPELLAQTGGGILCEPDSPNALAEALQQLLLDPARARQYGEAGRKAARQHFTIETMTDKTEAVLRKATHAA